MPTCRCPTGFTGPRCNQQVCTDYCQHNGSCTVNQGNQPSCRCLPTFIGDRCQYRECHPRCHGLGTAGGGGVRGVGVPHLEMSGGQKGGCSSPGDVWGQQGGVRKVRVPHLEMSGGQ